LIREGREAGEARSLCQQPFAIQFLGRLHGLVHLGQGGGGVQIGRFRALEGRRGLSGPVGAPSPQKALCGPQEGFGGLLNSVCGVGVQHFPAREQIAPRSLDRVEHRAAPQDALAAFREWALKFPLAGFLGPLRGSLGLCGAFCGLYAAFKVRNLACKAAFLALKVSMFVFF
jgi:hypothetical protein